jgi:putative FmdB family regulatory protein
MPIYEYQCNKCGNVFEVMQKFSDAPVKKHQKCGGKVEKLISRSGFQLKGGGWFASGYAKEDPKATSKDAKSESSSTESKTTESKTSESKSSDSKPSESKSTETKSSETKTESKPAAKAKKE